MSVRQCQRISFRKGVWVMRFRNTELHSGVFSQVIFPAVQLTSYGYITWIKYIIIIIHISSKQKKTKKKNGLIKGRFKIKISEQHPQKTKTKRRSESSNTGNIHADNISGASGANLPSGCHGNGVNSQQLVGSWQRPHSHTPSSHPLSLGEVARPSHTR